MSTSALPAAAAAAATDPPLAAMPATAYIETPRSRVRLHHRRLLVQSPSPEEEAAAAPLPEAEIHLHDLERLVLNETVQITTQAAAELLRSGIAIHFSDCHGRSLGGYDPVHWRGGASRLRQYSRQGDASFARHLALRLILAKTANQRLILLRLLHNRPRPVHAAIATLDAALRHLPRSTSLDQLRGAEGAAAAAYFPAWAQFLPDSFPFEQRSTRPPLNAVNACLSFASTLVANEFTSILLRYGLDPALGHLHTTDDRRPALALDLMEPFRPAFTEALTIRLFSHRLLNTDDFEARDGGVFLNTTGRQKFLHHYESRLQREFLSDHAGHRTSLRQQFTAAVTAYKAALDTPDSYRPFELNP